MMTNPENTTYAYYPLTFEAVRIMDEIRHENHCSEAICAYQENCVCWDDF